jgi:hypothetical protein
MTAEKLKIHLSNHKKIPSAFTSPFPNPFRTMPKDTPHRATSPPASRGGYTNFGDRSQAYDRGRGGAYTRGGGRSRDSNYGTRGAYQSYGGGGYRGRGGSRGGYSQPPAMPMQPTVNMMPFGIYSPLNFCLSWIGGFPQGGFSQGFFPNQEWQQITYPPGPPPPMMMSYGPPPNQPLMSPELAPGPHGLKRQRDG